MCVYEHLGELGSVPAKTWRSQTFVIFDRFDVVLQRCDYLLPWISSTGGMEMKRVRDDTLPNFLTPSDEAVEVCENVYNNMGGRQ